MPSSSIISSADTLTTVQPTNRFLRGTTIPTNFVYSFLVTPKKLLAARSFWLLYQLIVLLVTFAYYIKPPYFKYFFFFTNLTYFGLCVYLALAIFNSYRQLYTPLPPSTFAITLQQILYCNIAVFHLMVPTVYWLFLAQGYKSSIDAWTSISQHGIEFLVVVTEFFLGRMILNWWGLVIDVLIMGIYVGWSWIYNS
ncbi:hypothetical protein BKA69DRAFT_1046147 [Paraphysoderma sedebokerense]|nr:hypothetical protein BKA69DRAFT_1046147 [Paraphysoderma sedebokerense]